MKPTTASRTVAVLLALLLGPVVSFAGTGDSLGKMPQLFGMFQPVPGVWSEYSVTEKTSDKTSKMRMAIVGQEGDAFWYEVFMDDGQTRNVIKMLVRGNPNDPDNIQRMIMKSGDSPATEMPKDFVAMGRKMASHMFEKRSGVTVEGAAELEVKDEGTREVKVPAGTFQASVRKILDRGGAVQATYTHSDKVRPFGVVTSETDSNRMELLAYGADAKTLITETPVPLSGPPGMPAGMPRGMPPGMKTPGKGAPQ